MTQQAFADPAEATIELTESVPGTPASPQDADPGSFAAQVKYADPDDDTEAEGEPDDQPAADKSAEVDSDLSAKAEEYGLDPDDFASPEKMAKAIAAIDQRMAALRPEPEADKEDPAPNAELPAADAAEEDFELDPDIYDEGLIKALTSVKSKHAKEIEALRATVSRLEAHEARRQSEYITNQLDSFFDSLGKDYQDVFGAGPMEQIMAANPKSKEAAARLRVAEELDAIIAGDLKAGRKLESFEKMAKRALHSAYSDKVEKITQKKAAGQISQRRGQALSRPTQRAAKPITGEQAAVSFAEKFYQEKGISPSSGWDDADDRGI